MAPSPHLMPPHGIRRARDTPRKGFEPVAHVAHAIVVRGQFPRPCRHGGVRDARHDAIPIPPLHREALGPRRDVAAGGATVKAEYHIGRRRQVGVHKHLAARQCPSATRTVDHQHASAVVRHEAHHGDDVPWRLRFHDDVIDHDAGRAGAPSTRAAKC